jgi:hypothetical protein
LFTLASMTKRFLTLSFAIGFASICAVQAQSPAPGESPAGAPSPAKHRTHKKAQTTASPAETAASSAASPAAAPKAKGTRKKAETASPSPSPGKFSLGDLFKPKSSAAASPAAATRAPAKSTAAEAEAATNPPAPGGGHGLVWVNADTHVYHREGSHFYGTTKKGKYMTEAEAIKEGNKAAKAPGKGQ